MHDVETRLVSLGALLDEATPEIDLAEIERASRSLSEAPNRPGRRGRPVWIAVGAAAATLVLLGGVAVLFGGTNGAEPIDGPSPSIQETTTTTITTVPAATTATETTTSEPAAPAPLAMSWTWVESDAFGGPAQQTIEDIVVGGPGLVAVGSDGLLSDDADAAAWLSVDGRAWTRVSHDELAFGGSGAQLMTAVTTGGPGFVAVGQDRIEGVGGIAAVWTSEDGITWSRIPPNEDIFGGDGYQYMWDITAFESGLVAVGADWKESDIDAAVWISPDGIAWERIPHDETVFGGPQDQIMWAVVPAGPGLVAVGQGGDGVGAGGPEQPAAVWVSTDGRDWSRVSDQAELLSGFPDLGGGDWARMDDVSIGGPGLVAVGRVGRCGVGCDEDGAAWTSTDGIIWHRSVVEKAVGVRFDLMSGVAGRGDVLVGVGIGFDSSMELGPAVAWVSNDGGETWSRIPHSANAFGKINEGPNFMIDVVEFSLDLIAVGHWGSDAAVWIGTIEE